MESFFSILTKRGVKKSGNNNFSRPSIWYLFDMRKTGIKTADLGRNKHEFLVRVPQEFYDGLSKIALKNETSLNYQVNKAVRSLLIEAGLEREIIIR